MVQKKPAGALKAPPFDLTYEVVFPKFSHSHSHSHSPGVFQEMDLALFIFECLAQLLANSKLSINIWTYLKLEVGCFFFYKFQK